MERYQEQCNKKVKTRMTWDRKPITQIKDHIRYSRADDKKELYELIDEYYEDDNEQ